MMNLKFDRARQFIFVLGVQKSGTTSIHEFLSRHHDVSLPKIKETHFFSDTSLYYRGENWYINQFDLKKRVLCEVDPSYIFFPDVANRIRQFSNNPKFIVILRRPLERAFSHYLMSKYRGYEHHSFVSALDVERERIANSKNNFSYNNHSYLSRGEYAYQINQYISIFDKSNFLFIKFDDLINEGKQKGIL